MTKLPEKRFRFLAGESGATVFRVEREDGLIFVEKHAPASEIKAEAAVLRWCADRLPIPAVIQISDQVLKMTYLPGVNLTDVSLDQACEALRQALSQIHALPAAACPFSSNWTIRVGQASERLRVGLVDESDFEEENLGRNPTDMLAELTSLAPPPDLLCFTHGDASLENFLSEGGGLSGIVDWARAGITHPAQDWALALRSMRHSFGPEGERQLRASLPASCADEELLRRFRLLDEFF